MREPKLISPIEPQPPKGIKYMLGDETWLAPQERTVRRLHCEEWGNLGPTELNPDIKPNVVGYRVRTSDFIAPEGAVGFTRVGDIYYWTDTDQFGRTAADRDAERKDGYAITGYMCAIDFECELGKASGGNTVYPSVDDLKRRHASWEECGIVEVRVDLVKTIVQGEV